MIDAFSTIGVRENNQDAFAYAIATDGIMDVKIFHHNKPTEYDYDTSFPDGTKIMIVADGMGGLEGGELASYMTLTKFLNLVEKNMDPMMGMEDRIKVTIEQVSSYVHENAPESGSTIVGMIIMDGITVVFNVGDSKCIIQEDGVFIRTKDHTYGEELKSNIITDYIGMESNPDVRVTYYEKEIEHAIMFSDGLDPSYIQRGDSICIAPETAEQLCLEAKELGSQDNITCIKYSV